MTGFAEITQAMIGMPVGFAGELILYVITAILFIVVLDAVLRIVYLIIESFFG